MVFSPAPPAVRRQIVPRGGSPATDTNVSSDKRHSVARKIRILHNRRLLIEPARQGNLAVASRSFDNPLIKTTFRKREALVNLLWRAQKSFTAVRHQALSGHREPDTTNAPPTISQP